MVGRYFDRSIPIQCLIAQIYDVVISPIGKGFALDRQIAIRGSIGLHTLAAGELIRRTGRVLVNSQMKIRPRFLLDRHSIQYDLPIAYFYCVAGQADNTLRSEEHTSELQSIMRHVYAVFCMKKKTMTNTPEN